MIKHNLALILLICFYCSYSQSNFSDAVLFKSNGDSIKGQIDYRNWKLNPGIIIFNQDGGATQEFKPTDLKAFYVVPNQEYYVSEEVEVDQRAGDPVTVMQANPPDVNTKKTKGVSAATCTYSVL